MKRFLFIVLVFGGMALCSFATAAIALDVPLPSDILIVPPAPSLPVEIKAFSGKWGGSWWSIRSGPARLGGFDAILIVEKIINEREAIVTYCWGDSWGERGRFWNINKGCLKRFIADFYQKENETILSFHTFRNASTKATFRIKGDKLEGVDPVCYITMERIQ